MKRIYVAGKMSDKTPIEFLLNLNRGIKLAAGCVAIGCAVFCPFIDFQYFLNTTYGGMISMEQIKAHSMAWLEVSDAVLVVEEGWETSPGTAAELNRATELGNPVFFNLGEMVSHFEDQ